MVAAGVGLPRKTQFASSIKGIKPQLLMAILVFLLHIFAIGWLLHDRVASPKPPSELLLQFRLLPAASLNSAAPAIAPYRPSPASAITIKLPQPRAMDMEELAGSAVKAVPERGDPGIFDPRLRQKLSDIGSRVEVQPGGQLRRWTDASGARVVEIKQGECIRAMPGAANTRGDNWSLRFKCGKSESERMLDNINADMAERNRRKHNLSP